LSHLERTSSQDFFARKEVQNEEPSPFNTYHEESSSVYPNAETLQRGQRREKICLKKVENELRAKFNLRVGCSRQNLRVESKVVTKKE
jgi:hypothetical protein